MILALEEIPRLGPNFLKKLHNHLQRDFGSGAPTHCHSTSDDDNDDDGRAVHHDDDIRDIKV